MRKKISRPANLRQLEELYWKNSFPEELTGMEKFLAGILPLLGKKTRPRARYTLPVTGFWGAAAVAASVVALAGILTWSVMNLAGGGKAGLKVVSLTGTASLQPGGGSRKIVLKAGMTVRKSDRIVTLAGTVCDLRLAGRAAFRLAEQSELTITGLESVRGISDVRLDLSYGEIGVKPLPLKDGERFSVFTKQMAVSVTGTKFSVLAEQNGVSEVAVLEGAVSVCPNLDEIISSRGEVSEPVRQFLLQNQFRVKSGERLRVTGGDIDGVVSELERVFSSGGKTGKTGAPVRLPGRAGELLARFYRAGLRPIDLKAWENRNPLQDHSAEEPRRPVGAGKVMGTKPAAETDLRYAREESFSSAGRLVSWSEVSSVVVRDPDSGRLLRITAPKEAGQLSRPAVSGNRLVMGSENGGLFVYSADGRMLARSEAGGSMQSDSSPAVSGNTVALPTIDRGVQIFTMGSDRLEFGGTIPSTADAPHYATPLLLDEGRIVVTASDKGMVVAYDLRSKTILYQADFSHRGCRAPLLGDSRIALVTCSVGNVVAFRTMTGQMIWSRSLAIRNPSTLFHLVVSDRLIAVSGSLYQSELEIISLTGGELLASISMTQPVQAACISGETIYVGTPDGTVRTYGLDGREKPLRFRLDKKLKYLAAVSGRVQAYTDSGIVDLEGEAR